jgi:molybdenum cofactor cytidylyltransferase
MSTPELVGLLLAAGRGRRFDPQGVQDKLLQTLPDGAGVAVTAAKNLLAALPNVVAVVRADNQELARQLSDIGCEVTLCSNADEGMAASLVHALAHASEARGWIIALADMPHVRPATIRLLAAAIDAGAQIAIPTWQGGRGNPVAFSRIHLPELLLLRGDEGARRLLKAHPVAEVAVDDPGIRQDIDTPADLRR